MLTYLNILEEEAGFFSGPQKSDNEMKIVNFESPMRKKIEKGKSTSFHLFIVVVDTHSTTLCPVAKTCYNF